MGLVDDHEDRTPLAAALPYAAQHALRDQRLLVATQIMVIVGFVQVIMGLTAIFNEKFFSASRNYAFGLDVTAWGWIQLTVGALTLLRSEPEGTSPDRNGSAH